MSSFTVGPAEGLTRLWIGLANQVGRAIECSIFSVASTSGRIR